MYGYTLRPCLYFLPGNGYVFESKTDYEMRATESNTAKIKELLLCLLSLPMMLVCSYKHTHKSIHMHTSQFSTKVWREMTFLHTARRGQCCSSVQSNTWQSLTNLTEVLVLVLSGRHCQRGHTETTTHIGCKCSSGGRWGIGGAKGQGPSGDSGQQACLTLNTLIRT